MFYGSLGKRLCGDCRQMGDGISHPGHVDVVNIKRLPDSTQQCDCQPPTEVLAELFEAFKERRISQGRVIEIEPQRFEQPYDPLSVGAGKSAH